MPTQFHSESEPDASLPKADEGPEVRSSDTRLSSKQIILQLPSGATLFYLYLQLCFPFFSSGYSGTVSVTLSSLK